MKKNLFARYLVLSLGLIFLTLFNSCDKTYLDENKSGNSDFESVSTEKQSYIVILNDNGLNSDLAVINGYDRRIETVRSAASRILKRASVEDSELDQVYSTALKGFSVLIAPDQLSKLENDPSVVSVEKDQEIVLKPEGKASAAPAGQSNPWGIARVGGGVSSTGKTAWIIDTGIDLDHPDLNVNTTLGKTFVARTNSANDDNGHGSHVAGIIGAKNNTIGVIGVAAGASVVPVKVLDKRGSGYVSTIISGIDYVASKASSGDVANMSLGGGISTDLDKAVYNASLKGIRFVLAAGNESDDANNHSPARVNGTNIFTVSAMGQGDKWASFSNYGSSVDWCAPGVSIYSCYKDGGYGTMSGTSMAAPHVAGLLLLGAIKADGTVIGDPDGNPDPIAHR